MCILYILKISIFPNEVLALSVEYYNIITYKRIEKHSLTKIVYDVI